MVFTGVSITSARIADNVRMAVEAERAGYTHGWAAEVSGPDAMTIMVSAIAATSTLKLATGIISTFTRSPYLAAMSFASMADYSEGRVEAGFGTSTPAIVEGWHGLPFPKPIQATREYVDLFKKFIAGERVKASGIYNVRGASLWRPSPHPIPVYLAALNDRMLELSAEIADGVILNFPTPTYFDHAMQVINAALARHGRDRKAFIVSANFRTGLVRDGEPRDALQNMLRRELITYFMAPVYQKVWSADNWGDEVQRISGLWRDGDRANAVATIREDFVEAHGIFGDEAECRARVGEYMAKGLDQANLFPVVAEGPNTKDRQIITLKTLGPK